MISRRSVFVWVSVATMATAAFVALHREWHRVPQEWLPWSPLVVADKPNLWTRHKLSRLSSDAAACLQVLSATDIEFEVLADQVTGEDCGFQNAVLVQRAPAAVGQPFSLTCRTAVSMALWDRHVLQPAGQRYFGQRVAGIEHFGSYSCRNVYGRPNATRSRHATAEAWDVAGFRLADGRRVRVVTGWSSTEAEAAFLREVRDGACHFFDGVLGPDYNEAHRDHLHLDRGPYRVCR